MADACMHAGARQFAVCVAKLYNHTRIKIYARMCMCIYLYVCMYMYIMMYAYICVCIYIGRFIVYVYVLTAGLYSAMPIHTYVHMYKHARTR